MSIVFFHNEEQRQLILQTKAEVARARAAVVTTEIVPYTNFTLAEDYHQKFTLQQEPELMAEFRQMYPRWDDFVNSTAAARLNGFTSGYGEASLLNAELDTYGLSDSGKQALQTIAQRYFR